MAIQYAYRGRDTKGNSRSGKIAATSDAEARAKLRIMGVTVTSLGSKEGGSAKAGGGAGGGAFSFDLKNLSFFRPKVNSDELSVFTKQLSVMIDAGLAIVQALDMLANQATNIRMKQALTGIRERIEGGFDLATAMEKYPDVFDSLYSNLVRAGSASGQLDVMLRKLSVYIEKSNKLKKQLISALSYPVMILGIAVLMTSVMLLFVVPMFAKNYTDSGKELPALTQIVISWSEGLQENFMLIGGACAAMGYLFKTWKKSKTGSVQWDQILLKLPIFGGLLVKISMARFSSTMATLISSGISIIEALEVCSRAAGNVVIERDIMRLREEVAKGKGLAGPMATSPWFPPMVVGMVSIGEASGGLDTMLAKVASLYEEDVDAALAATLKLIEPAMFVLIGGIVGFILLAMYLPIFDLASTIN